MLYELGLLVFSAGVTAFISMSVVKHYEQIFKRQEKTYRQNTIRTIEECRNVLRTDGYKYQEVIQELKAQLYKQEKVIKDLLKEKMERDGVS